VEIDGVANRMRAELIGGGGHDASMKALSAGKLARRSTFTKRERGPAPS